MSEVVFRELPKIPRWSRRIIITEKIDGTNGLIYVGEDGTVKAGSKSQWLTPEKGKDNHGFARWVSEHEVELKELGPGYHHGEWWGNGINRGYGLKEGDKRFSLINSTKWKDVKPKCCEVIPILYDGIMDDIYSPILKAIDSLKLNGSIAAPGYMSPEGIVIFHVQGNLFFKKTLQNDEVPKSLAGKE